MLTIQLYGGAQTIVDDDIPTEIITHKWHLGGNGYVVRECPKDHAEYLHRVIMGAKKGQQIDHINHDPLDNRRVNLRIVTNQQNCAWQGKRKGSSRYKGVSWSQQRNRWVAGIKHNYKRIALGRYVSEEAAALAYDRAAKEFFGEYAYLNFPEGSHER